MNLSVAVETRHHAPLPDPDRVSLVHKSTGEVRRPVYDYHGYAFHDLAPGEYEFHIRDARYRPVAIVGARAGARRCRSISTETERSSSTRATGAPARSSAH